MLPLVVWKKNAHLYYLNATVFHHAKMVICTFGTALKSTTIVNNATLVVLGAASTPCAPLLIHKIPSCCSTCILQLLLQKKSNFKCSLQKDSPKVRPLQQILYVYLVSFRARDLPIWIKAKEHEYELGRYPHWTLILAQKKFPDSVWALTNKNYCSCGFYSHCLDLQLTGEPYVQM